MGREEGEIWLSGDEEEDSSAKLWDASGKDVSELLIEFEPTKKSEL